MIRLWLTSRTSTSIREQLGAQLLLGILSGRLAPGERLPSIRGLAKRLRIHPNTVSSVYRDLSERGWVQTRRGSGVFVRAERPSGDGLAAFVSEWLEAAQRRGFTLEALEGELQRLRQQSPAVSPLLVVDPDGELARIIAAEITVVLARPVAWATASGVLEAITTDSRVFVNAGHVGQVAPVLGTHPFETIRLKSMQDVMAGQTRPKGPVLIGLVSRSQTVRAWASTLLSALGFAAEGVLLRNPAALEWQEGLGACDILAADVCAARELPPSLTPVVFRIVADASLAAIQRFVTVHELSHPPVP